LKSIKKAKVEGSKVDGIRTKLLQMSFKPARLIEDQLPYDQLIVEKPFTYNEKTASTQYVDKKERILK